MSNQTNPADSNSVKELWGKEADEHVRYGKGFHWVESPLVMRYIQEQVTGNPNENWLTYSYQRYIQARSAQVYRVLSLGCGGGALERGLCDLGFSGRIDAYDFSEGAIEHARAVAAQEKLGNIHYLTCDLNQAEFPAETYNIVFSSSALHHISNLEHLLDQIRLGLVEGGLLIINEYVGPFQLQWTPQQTKIIDELLHLLPKKYRKRVSAPDQFKDAFLGPSPIREMDSNDPSESIRSDEIIPLIRARFQVKEQKNFGGTILHMLLQDIVGNFDPADPIDASFLNMLIYVEKVLIQEKVVGSDFAYLVAEKSNEAPVEKAATERPIDLAWELKARDVRIRSMNERVRQGVEYARALQNQIQQWSKHCQNLNLEMAGTTAKTAASPNAAGRLRRTITHIAAQIKERCKSGIHGDRIFLAAILITLLKLLLVTGQQVTAVYGPHDDLLFLAHAKDLEALKWLGSYNNLTLSKGMFYPLWIAVLQAAGMPLLLAQHVLYIFACALTVRALRPWLQSSIMRLLLYAFLLFNPMSYAVESTTRVLRDGIYASLTLLVVACSIALLLRLNRPVQALVGWSVALGVSLSCFWLTREEGPWIAPLLLIILGAALVLLWREKPVQWSKLAVVGALPVVILLSSLGAVATINKLHYGVFCTVEFKDSNFLDAYGALSRVKPSQWKQYYPLLRENRERIYAVSPAFAELKPFLEGYIGVGWTSTSCRDAGLCDDIGGGWFMWAFRDAVAAAGHYKSGGSAMAYYRRLASEVNGACETHRLDCVPPRATLLPVWHREYDRPLLHTLLHSATYLSRLSGFNAHPAPSLIPISELDLFSAMTHERISPPQVGRFHVAGWAFAQTGSPLNFSILSKNGQQAEASVSRTASPDVYEYYLARGEDIPAAHNCRFEITTPCYPDCSLVIDSSGGISEKIPLDGSVQGQRGKRLSFWFDNLSFAPDIPSYSTGADKIKVKILDIIGKCYQALMPAITLFSLAGYLIWTIFLLRRRLALQFWIITTAVLAAIGARLMLLSIIQVTLFNGINPRYLQPLYPLLILFQFLSLAGCVYLVGVYLASRTGARHA